MFRREGELNGLVFVFVFIVCDVKFGNLCKLFNLRVELNFFLFIFFVMRVVVKLLELFVILEEEFWIRRKKFYFFDFMLSLN